MKNSTTAACMDILVHSMTRLPVGILIMKLDSNVYEVKRVFLPFCLSVCVRPSVNLFVSGYLLLQFTSG